MGGALIEREREREEVAAALRALGGGSGRIVVLEGPAGIGKSALLRESVAAAAGDGAFVLNARAVELEQDVAQAVTRRLLEPVLGDEAGVAIPAPLAAEAAGVLAAPDSSEGTGGEFPKLEVLHAVCVHLSAMSPLVLAIDDVHWCDEPSLRFLLFVASRLEHVPIVVLLALRPAHPGAAHPMLGKLLLDPEARLLRLSPLTLDGVRNALAELLECQPPGRAFAEACHAATGGNPFLLEELSRELAGRRLEPSEEAAGAIAALRPASISRAVLFRLAAAGASAIHAARALAVLGRESSLGDLATVAELSEGSAADALAALIEADIATYRDGRAAFLHPIVAAAVDADIDPATRAAGHARAAALLMARGEPPVHVAPHLIHAPRSGSEDMRQVLVAAAAAARAEGSPAGVVKYLRRALEEQPDRELEPELLAQLAVAEARIGEPGATDRLRAAVVAVRDPRARVEVTLDLARGIVAQGDAHEAAALLDEAAGATPEQHLADRLRAEWYSIALLDPLSAGRAATELSAVRIDEREDATALVLKALVSQRRAVSGATAEEAAELAEQSLAHGRLLEEESVECPAFQFAVWVLLQADRYHVAQAALDQALGDARASGASWGLVLVRSLQAISALRRGDLAQAEVESRRGLDATQLRGAPQAFPDPLPFLVEALVEQGKLDEAAEALDQAEASAPVRLEPRRCPLIAARGRLRDAQHRPREALEDHVLDGRLAQRAVALSTDLGWRARAVPPLLETGRAGEAAALAAEELERTRRWGAPRDLGIALRVAASVATAERRLGLLEESVAVLERSPVRLELARSLAAHGMSERDRGDVRSAREVLRRALDLAHRCGAGALEVQVHDALLSVGARPQRPALSGAGALTPSQRRVAELAADGLTNQEIAATLFVSPKTVETHLREAFRKLGVSSRKQLTG